MTPEAIIQITERLDKLEKALIDIKTHSEAPFAKVDPRTDNWKWLNYVNHVAREALNAKS